MPVVTDGSKLLPKLDLLYSCEQQQRLCARLSISICALTVLATILFLLHRSVWSRLAPRRLRLLLSSARPPTATATTTSSSTWTSPRRATTTTTTTTKQHRGPQQPSQVLPGPAAAIPSDWVRPGQGQGCLGKEANLTISRGEETCGTALAGLGGFHDGSAMEEEEERTRKPAPSGSRGVSTGRSDGSGPSTGFSYYPSPSLPATAAAAVAAAAEQDDHARTSPSPLPSALARDITGGLVGPAEQGQDSMDYDGRGGFHSSAGVGSGPMVNAPSYQRSMFSFGQHMTDDEHVIYSAGGPSALGTGVFRDHLEPRRFDLDFNRPPSPPVSTTMSTTLSSAKGRREHWTSSVPIASSPAPATRLNAGSDDSISPSSYPSTSPLLPPPPPTTTMTATTEYPFDPSAIMFPGGGPVIDGGIRMVPVHDHGEAGGRAAGPHHHNNNHNHSNNNNSSSAGWRRHTRVYGGGVCLACAAGADGGFYGTRVRPEDKRQ